MTHGTLLSRLSRWALLASPSHRRDWAAAMIREVEEIADGRAALGWALGCLFACLQERIRSMRTLMITARLGLAGACALFATGTAVPLALILAWRAGSTPALGALSGALAGDDYHRLAPLLDGAPDWLLLGGLISIALHLAAGVLVVLRRASAPWVFAAVVFGDATIMAINHQSPAFQSVFSAAELRSDYVGLALAVAVAAAMFLAVRQRDSEANG